MQWDIGKPNPRQIEFFKARARFIAYGGARGGGKSWAVRKKAAGLALSYPGAGILIVRRTFPEPVSYTHLDVYKRQAQHCEQIGRNYLLLCGIPKDVYKRQPLTVRMT